VEGVQQLLTRPGDTQAYTDTLLCKTLVAFESAPPAKQQGWRLSQRFSQEQVGLQKLFWPSERNCWAIRQSRAPSAAVSTAVLACTHLLPTQQSQATLHQLCQALLSACFQLYCQQGLW